MNKFTISRNILLTQMFVSTVILAFVVYFVYPFIEKNKELMGAYYTLTTILSFLLGFIVEALMIKKFEAKKEKAKQEAINSTPTAENEAYRNQLIQKEKNKKIEEYRRNFE